MVKLQLMVRGMNLPKTGIIGRSRKSDAFVVIYEKNEDEELWRRIATTSTVRKETNPQWKDLIPVDLEKGKKQKVKLDVYNRLSDSQDLADHGFIGSIEKHLFKIYENKEKGYTANLYETSEAITEKSTRRKKNRIPPSIFVIAEEAQEEHELVEFKFSAQKLDRKNLMGFGKSDPFFVINLLQKDERFSPIFTSEHIKKNLNPVWKRRRLPLQQICNGDKQRQIRIDVFDYESSQKHQFIGCFTTSVERLRTQTEFNIVNAKSKANKESSGVFHVMKFDILDQPTPQDYLKSGCEMKLITAIDFSGSKGNLRLHADKSESKARVEDEKDMNVYEQAIYFLTLILNYDTDHKIPIYGFGGKLTQQHQQTKGRRLDMGCFPLTFDLDNHNADGEGGVMKSYQNSLASVVVAGKSKLAKVIRMAIKEAGNATQQTQSYSLLLILTNGIINDKNETIQALIESSKHPLSIIIVGLGETSNFDDVEGLDVLASGGAQLSVNGKEAERSNVQFIPFKRFQTKRRSFSSLAVEILRKATGQMIEYMNLNGISPGLTHNSQMSNTVVETNISV